MATTFGTLDVWKTPMSIERTRVELATVADAVALVGRLDGRRTPLAMIDRDGATMAVAGGPEDFMLYIERSDGFWALRDPTRSGGPAIAINSGGQVVDLPPDQCPGRSLVERAVATFFATGEPDTDLTWEQR